MVPNCRRLRCATAKGGRRHDLQSRRAWSVRVRVTCPATDLVLHLNALVQSSVLGNVRVLETRIVIGITVKITDQELAIRLSKQRVVLAGLFSARAADPAAVIDALGRSLEATGALVVGRVVQRRGVSRDRRPGGSKRMDRPMSAATVIGSGKARELATLCANTNADLVVFHNTLTGSQRETLTVICGIPVHDAASLGI
jgi:hypothetical protein